MPWVVTWTDMLEMPRQPKVETFAPVNDASGATPNKGRRVDRPAKPACPRFFQPGSAHT